jgi:large subunit ribosomal protein L33
VIKYYRLFEGGIKMREKAVLVCTVCLSRNYSITKVKSVSKERFEITKFCKKCNAHTLHKESK